MAKAQYWNGHKILFQSTLFGKEYFFMEDPHDGCVWLAGAEPVIGVSYNPETEEAVPVIEGYRPKIIV